MKVFNSSEFLPHEISGDQQSKNLVIFIHGWPNTCRIWDGIISKLSDSYILSLTYPGHDTKTAENLSEEVIARRIKNTIEFYDSGHSKNRIHVAHDWGAYYTYVFDVLYPKTVDHLITLDVSPYAPQQKLAANLILVTYQWFLIFAYIIYKLFPFIGVIIGNYMTHLCGKILKYDDADVTVKMNYHYLNIWMNKILKKVPITKDYKPSVGIQYIYGKNKPIQFQNDRWLEIVKQSPNGSVQELDGGHWITVDFPDQVVKTIQSKTVSNSRN